MSSETARVKYACPRCESDQIQRFAVVFQTGTARSTHHTSGIGIGGHSEGIGLAGFGAVTESASSTLLASQLAPPETKPSLFPNLMRGVCIIFTLVALTAFVQFRDIRLGIVVAIGLAGFWSNHRRYKNLSKWNKEEYPKLVDEWERSWVCHKCGHTFQLPS